MAKTARIPYYLKPITVIKDIKRIKDIIAVLLHHGFEQIVDILSQTEIYKISQIVSNLRSKLSKSKGKGRNNEFKDLNLSFPERLRLVFQDLGPTFIKLGQILSCRPDLIPNEYVNEFKKLQDNVAPFPFSEAKKIIQTELKTNISEIFSEFDEVPIGSASIGQVYKATLKNGIKVVVKVQRPNIEDIIKCDLDILKNLVSALERRFDWISEYNLLGIVDEFEKAIKKELDYSNELRNGIKFKNIFKSFSDVIIPTFYREYSTKKVLTMEYIEGVKLANLEGLQNINKKHIANVAINTALIMIFEAGFFHADPHPGNIFIVDGNKLALLDVGLVGVIDEVMRFKLAELCAAIVEKDIDEICRLVLHLSSRSGNVEKNHLRRDIAELVEKIDCVPLEEIRFSEVLSDMFNISSQNNLVIPTEFFLLAKSLITVEGIAKQLDPQLDIQTAITPYIKNIIASKYSPQTMAKQFLKQLSDITYWMQEMPILLKNMLEDIQAGNLNIKVSLKEYEKLIKNIDTVINRLSSAIVISAVILSSSIFLNYTKFEYTIMGLPAGLFLGIVGYIVGVILSVRFILKSFEKIDE